MGDDICHLLNFRGLNCERVGFFYCSKLIVLLVMNML